MISFQFPRQTTDQQTSARSLNGRRGPAVPGILIGNGGRIGAPLGRLVD